MIIFLVSLNFVILGLLFFSIVDTYDSLRKLDAEVSLLMERLAKVDFDLKERQIKCATQVSMLRYRP